MSSGTTDRSGLLSTREVHEIHDSWAGSYIAIEIRKKHESSADDRSKWVKERV
jgi:hypothetical protein